VLAPRQVSLRGLTRFTSKWTRSESSAISRFTDLGGAEYYGSVGRIGADDFTINEVDQRREITLRYNEVTNVRADYGTTRNIYGRRIHPHTKLIVTLAVVGGLIALVFVAVAADKS